MGALAVATSVVAAIAVGRSVFDHRPGDHDRGTPVNVLNSIPPSMRGKGAPRIGTTSVAAKLETGSRTIINSTYVDREGDVCSALLYEVGGISQQSKGGGCVPAAALAAQLLREHAAAVSVVSGEKYVLFQGYASSDIEGIVSRGRNDRISVALSRPWTPRLKGSVKGPRLTSFLVRMPSRRQGDIRELARNYELIATFAGGRRVAVGGLLNPSSSGASRRRDLVDPIVRSAEASGQDQNHRFGLDMTASSVYSAYRQMEGVVDSGGSPTPTGFPSRVVVQAALTAGRPSISPVSARLTGRKPTGVLALGPRHGPNPPRE